MLIYTVINIVLFFKFTFNTFIQFHWVFGIYGFAFIIANILTLKTKSRYVKYLIRYELAPGIVSTVFVLNFLISFNPQTKTFKYSYDYVNAPPIFPAITLENNTYSEYKAIRTFFVKEEIMGNYYVTYEIKDGIFGFKAATGTSLHLTSVNHQ